MKLLSIFLLLAFVACESKKVVYKSKEEIAKDIKELNIEKLQQLKYKWKVSMAALLERARRLTIINELKYINFRKEFSYRKWLLEEPGKLPSEEPFLLKEIIEAYQEIMKMQV